MPSGRRGRRPLQRLQYITSPTSHLSHQLSKVFLLFFTYKIPLITNIVTDKACDILIGPSIRLSVLSPSIIALTNEYIIKYKYVIWPLNFLFLDTTVSIINIANVDIDSYKNVGCTSIYFPASYIPILHGKFVCVPCASTFTKFPHLPIACPKC